LKRLINFKKFSNEKKFIEKFNLWEEKYRDFLNEKTITRSHIRNAIPYMFYYLKDDNIKKSNNDLE